jgi:hypothetical protein
VSRPKAYLLTALIATPLIIAYFLFPWVHSLGNQLVAARHSWRYTWRHLVFIGLAALLGLAWLVFFLLGIAARVKLDRERLRRGLPPTNSPRPPPNDPV